MRKNRHYLYCAIVAGTAALSGCYHEAPIYSELGHPKYEIQDGTDYVTHTIYQIKQETGIQVIYDFTPGDALWDLGTPMTKGFGKKIYIPIDKNDPTDMAMLEPNLKYIKENFLDAYDTEFKKKYFPVRIFLADSLKRNKSVEDFAYIARDHIAINLYKENESMRRPTGIPRVTTKEEYFTQLAPQLHSSLWQFVFTHRLAYPNSFHAFSSEYYTHNLGERKDPRYDIRMAGFWTYDEANSFKYYKAIDAATDIADYIYRMTSMSEDEIVQAAGGYQIMIDKYNALRQAIKDLTGIDLQEIGNATARKRQQPQP